MRALSLPEPMVWLMYRFLVRPFLGWPVPIRLQRVWLAIVAVLSPMPAGVHRRATRLGGVPVVFFQPRTPKALQRDPSVASPEPPTPEPPSPETGGAMIFYLHGGAFITGSARTHGPLAAYLAATLGRPLLFVEYRLAPEFRYPAGRQDALAAYRAVLESGQAPEQITLMGDSVGAVLVIDLIRDLHRMGLPLPGAAILLSPAVGLGAAPPPARKTPDSLLRRTWIERGWLEYRRTGTDSDPILTDPDVTWATTVPWYIQYSESELLAPFSEQLIQKFRSAGADVTVQCDPGPFHVLALAPGLMSRARESITSCGRFLGE